MREFIVAAKRTEEKAQQEGVVRETTPMKMDDGHVIQFFKPSPTQMAVIAGISESRNIAEQAAVAVNLLLNIVSESDRRYLTARLMDREDDLELEDFLPNLEALIEEEWGGRPTRQPSDYLPPQSTSGQSSTVSRKKTSSRSRSTGS